MTASLLRFNAGINTLSFTVVDTSGAPAGLLVCGLTGDASLVPEPATWAPMIGGFGLVGVSLRGRQSKVSYSQAIST